MTGNYKWTYRNKEINKEIFSEIKEAVGSGITASLLINRGIKTSQQAKEFLAPKDMEISSPYIFPDMQKAVNKVNELIKTQERIVIYGDFDADGVTSTALLYKTLKHLDANIGYYIPDRTEEGHGLHRAALCKLISKEKVKLFITVDCGISNVSEIKLAESLGTSVIITDHHEPSEELPEAHAIINPKTLDTDPTGLKHLAGVGVAFKLAEALLESNDRKEYVDEILYLVAIGTVGDVVPLLGENRSLVHQGLELLSRKKPPGIAKLLEISKCKPDKKISSSIVAFTIVPRINAVGRLSVAKSAVEFLVTDENEERLNFFAEELEKNNKERQQICEETFKQAEEKIKFEVDLNNDKALILADPNWHAGIVGIVASKLVEKYDRPALLIALDNEKKEARCSARSIEGLNLFETLSVFSDYFIQFGGHALAAGFTSSLEKITFEDLRKLILNHINKTLNAEKLQPELKIDMNIESKDLTTDFINELDKLAPYGESNAYPIFAIPDLTLKSIAPLGKKKNHLKIFLSDTENNCIECVWWQKDNLNINPSEKVDVAFIPSLNSYMDKDTIQLIIKDIRKISDRNKVNIQPIQTQISEEELLEQDDLFFNPENSEIKWLDYRQEKGFKREYINYLKSIRNNLSVFAESRRSLEIIENIDFLKPCLVNRLNIKSSKYLILLDLPCDDMTFINIIKKIDPEEIHLFGLINDIVPVDLIKQISGMLKYAYNEKQGIINLEKASSAAGISVDLFLNCVELLDSAKVVEIQEINEDSIQFNFNGSVNLTVIQSLQDYQDFIESLKAFDKHKKEYKTKEIGLIKETINNCCSLIEAI